MNGRQARRLLDGQPVDRAMPTTARRSPIAFVIVFAVVFAANPSGAHADAQPRLRAPSLQSGGRWHLTNAWSQSEGLPQDRVYSILQTRDGYIWIGTRAGAARFDGVRFTTFDQHPTSPIRDDEAWALAEDDDGGLWVGTYGGGLALLKNGKSRMYTTRDGLVDNFVRALARDASGALWIGTDNGLGRLANGEFTSFAVADGLSNNLVRALCPDRDGGIWVATQPSGGGGLHYVEHGRVDRVAIPGFAAVPSIEAMLQDRSGGLWLATLDGLLHWAEGRVTRYGAADGLASDRVRALYEDGAGIWIASDDGVDLRRPGERSFQPIVRQSLGSTLTAVHVDREGGVWIGTRGRGLARFNRGLFASYTTADGLPDPEVTTVLVDRRGTVWVGTGRGLCAFTADGFVVYGAAHGLTNESVGALAEDRDGSLWVGTDSGVFRAGFRACAGCAPRFERIDGVPATLIRVIHVDEAGHVWIGTNGEGLLRYDGRAFDAFTTQNGLSHNAIRAIERDGEGGLWIGTKGGGLNRLNAGRFEVHTEKHGLPNNSIQSLHLDAEGTLWISTRHGVSRRKAGRYRTISRADGLFASHVYGFAEDGRGNLWLTSGRGIFRMSLEQMHAFADGRARSVFSVAYGREHGLTAPMAAVSRHPLTARVGGRILFAMAGGLAVLDPGTVTVNALPPPVHLEEMTINGEPFATAADAVSKPGRGDLTFRYTALNLAAPEKATFRYRLEGFDSDWTDAGTRRLAFYTNVPPGRYRFRVIARNSDGVWNETGSAIGMTLEAHFYRTTWFYSACVVAAIAAAVAAHRFRLARLRARQHQLTARVKEAIAQIKILSGLLPTCASCKRIRDDRGQWSQMESYIKAHSEAEFSHGICPECTLRLYPQHAHRLGKR
jgi:ligand-binding sensor domain-containing protein